MRPRLPNAALALGLTAALSLGGSTSTSTARLSGPRGAGPSVLPANSEPVAPCPAGTLPDGDACVRLPGDEDRLGAPDPESSLNTHRDVAGRWIVYDEIPRRPERPDAYEAYRYPVPCEGRLQGKSCVVSGYDLDRSDDQQRRAHRLRQVGHGAVDLAAARGTPVVTVALEHQEGDAEVVYVGSLFGTTVVARHSLREGGRLRDYLVLFGHLDAAAPGLRPGGVLREGDVVGFVGDSGSPGLVHLHLEVRRVRDGLDASRLAPAALVDGAVSVVCDPRNVLPLR
jgi:murein DD-endopeptidase MepM/ murein hydrolase activator NlpD